MIEINSLCKYFGDFAAVDHLSCRIEDGWIFGMVGPNGAGKSTLLRLLCGVYRPDEGEVLVDGQPVFENPPTKEEIFFVADDPFFYGNSTMNSLADFYASVYKNFSREEYKRLCEIFPIDPKGKLNSFSKGMRRQAILVLALSCMPKYLLLDEAFDGIDPVIRALIKRLLIDAVMERNMTVIISSHNLRELEEFCDHIGLLHKGGILFERELDDLRLGLHKFQLAFETVVDPTVLEGLDLVSSECKGRLVTLVARGERDAITAQLEAKNPLFLEVLPLTLEEVFISEMEGVGYDFSKILL